VVRPTARVLALLEILQAGGTRTVGDLAGLLDVDERTVRRYVAHLLDLDIPVESVRGRYGGYRLGPGYKLPPLMLTDDEATAVLVGLVSTTRHGSGAAKAAAESAAAKVRRVLPRRLGAQLGALLDVTDVTDVADGTERSPVGPPPEAEVLLLVAEAVRARRAVDIVHANRLGRVTERAVRPYGIVAHAGHWYLTGLDAASDEVRTFRLDRVSKVRPTAESFEVPAGFRPGDEVLGALARTPWRHTVSVRVHAEADTVRARLPTGIATVTPLVEEQGWTRVEIRAEQLDWVPGVLAAVDADLVVESPDELRDRVAALGRRLIAAGGDQATRP
jgi:predicted DNA-binding transcriptional regulator YafY